MVTGLILAAGLQATAAGGHMLFDCRMVLEDMTLQSVTLDVDLAGLAVASNNQDRTIRVTVAEGGETVFPSVQLPETVEATSRSPGPTEPGYVQFALGGSEAVYLVALHSPEGRNMAAAIFVSRSDRRDWRRNWYQGNGFCARRSSGVSAR